MDHTPDHRIGDGDRALALDRLGQYFADGYLDVDEFETRTGEAAVARTREEIAALFVDLPEQSADSTDVVALGPGADMQAQRELDEVMERGHKIQRLDGIIWAVVLITFFVGTFVVSIPFSWVVFPLGAFASWGCAPRSKWTTRTRNCLRNSPRRKVNGGPNACARPPSGVGNWGSRRELSHESLDILKAWLPIT